MFTPTMASGRALRPLPPPRATPWNTTNARNTLCGGDGGKAVGTLKAQGPGLHAANTMEYYQYVPKGVDVNSKTEKYPLVLVSHGSNQHPEGYVQLTMRIV